jgi:glycosyltransferase involved in cell wall biosynthesis
VIYAGQVIEQKGVHTALEAFLRVARDPRHADLTLTIVGGSVEPAYLARLRRVAAESPDGNRVSFTGPVPREQLPAVLTQHDILVFPSEWDEPFSIGLVEAMATGLAVVSTKTGGSGELVADGVNALTYEAGSVEGCANRLSRLLNDQVLYDVIRHGARESVETQFRFDDMGQAIEATLAEIVGDKLTPTDPLTEPEPGHTNSDTPDLSRR